jgi:hypothetical protein
MEILLLSFFELTTKTEGAGILVPWLFSTPDCEHVQRPTLVQGGSRIFRAAEGKGARGARLSALVGSLSSFAGGNLLADVGVDIKGSNHRFALKQVPTVSWTIG